LIRHGQNDGVDERLHSVEIQTEQAISLKDNLLAIIIPARFFDDDRKRHLEQKWNCKVVMYNLQAVFSPVNLMSLIFDKVREVLLSDGQIS
jgi:hypothetical protein